MTLVNVLNSALEIQARLGVFILFECCFKPLMWEANYMVFLIGGVLRGKMAEGKGCAWGGLATKTYLLYEFC